jgi:hypothetical protein
LKRNEFIKKEEEEKLKMSIHIYTISNWSLSKGVSLNDMLKRIEDNRI